MGIRELLPCEDPMTGVTYMNRADVREALHVRENTGLPPWTQCRLEEGTSDHRKTSAVI